MDSDEDGKFRTPHLSHLLSLKDDDLQRIILSQQHAFSQLRTEAREKFHAILAILSLASSLGFIKYVSRPEIWQISLNIPDNLFNRCLPEAAHADGVTLAGVGYFNLFLLFGILALTLTLFYESWQLNSRIQSMDEIQISAEIGTRTKPYPIAVIENQLSIKEAKRILNTLNDKFLNSALLLVLGAIIIAMSALGQALSLLISDFLLVLGGLAVTALWINEKRHPEKRQPRARLFPVGGNKFDPSQIVFVLVELFAIIILWDYWKLLSETLIC